MNNNNIRTKITSSVILPISEPQWNIAESSANGWIHAHDNDRKASMQEKGKHCFSAMYIMFKFLNIPHGVVQVKETLLYT